MYVYKCVCLYVGYYFVKPCDRRLYEKEKPHACAERTLGGSGVVPQEGLPPNLLLFSHVAAMVSTIPVSVKKPNRVRNKNY